MSFVNLPSVAQPPKKTLPTAPNPSSEQLDIPSSLIQQSPTLQRWLKKVPNVLEEIRNDPSFSTRVRIGFTSFPSNEDAGGINLGVEDIFIDRTGLTISADYYGAKNGDRHAAGVDLHYFLLPLGSYANIAPVVGYRYVQSHDFNSDGLHLGMRLMLALSRTGGGDLSITQSFVAPTSNQEVGITSLSVGYAIFSDLRLSGDLEWQNSPKNQDSRVGINLEWLF
ncbi:hypothetical protein NIES4102_04820 [Chondrocystis sp. NIES-4102]|nr:hypothetical protein NIES4102_04820 [Chondrocystis sp. NIES-4102]